MHRTLLLAAVLLGSACAQEDSRPTLMAGATGGSEARPATPPTLSGQALPGQALPGQADDEYLKYDPATNTVTFKLVAGPFVFNGFGSGGATLSVPAKSNLVINFVQDDGTPHSAEVSSGEGPLPNEGGNPAIPRAYTNKVIEGLVQEATDVMRFTVPDSGTYRIICGVPGHTLSGMWLWMKVDPGAKEPRFGKTTTK